MKIIPSIYIQNNCAVSWYKGHENEQAKKFWKTPLEFAQAYKKAGTCCLQLVDLDGTGRDLIKRIVAAVPGVEVQTAGSIRTFDDIQQLLDCGVARVVVNVTFWNLLADAMKKFGPEKILLGLKSKGDRVIADHLPDLPERDIESAAARSQVVSIAQHAIDLGVTGIVYKDMEHEGTLFHPNFDEIDRLVSGTNAKIYAAGGIATMEDLRLLKKIGVYGAIIGRAFAEKELDLRSCVQNF